MDRVEKSSRGLSRQQIAAEITAVLKPPAQVPTATEVIATFGAHLTPLLPERKSSRLSILREDNGEPHPGPDKSGLYAPPIITLTDGESSSAVGPSAMPTIEEVFACAEALGRTRREAQLELARLAADTLRDGGYAVIEAGTGIGKSQGYSLPAQGFLVYPYCRESLPSSNWRASRVW